MRAEAITALLTAEEEELRQLMAALTEEQRDAIKRYFPIYAHKGQLPPIDGWRTWLIMAGRGFGKTRAGAEWVLGLVRGEWQNVSPSSLGEGEGVVAGCEAARSGVEPDRSETTPNPSFEKEGLSNLHIALIGATIDEARRVMVEGPSGILALAGEREIESWSPSRRELRFTNGAVATLYSGAQAEGLRGPEHHFAWCDELAKWTQGEDAWMNLQLGMRCGERPRVLITTTPKRSELLSRIIAMPDTVETGGPTQANPHLPADFIAAMEARFAGTRIGRQELDGELLDDVEGSLWPSALVEACRIPPRHGEGDGAKHGGGGPQHSEVWRGGPPPSAVPAATSPSRGVSTHTIIGVDPPATTNGTCGIIVCGRDANRHAHVLDDRSLTGASPEQWAAAVARAARDWGADQIVAERNQGGDMVKAVLKAADAKMRVKLVHAAKGKSARAEPVALLFEQGRAFFDGRFPELEAELGGLQNGGAYAGPGPSPDRADAMVWAMTALMLGHQAELRVRAV